MVTDKSLESLYEEYFDIATAVDELNQWTAVHGECDLTFADALDRAHYNAMRKAIAIYMDPSYLSAKAKAVCGNLGVKSLDLDAVVEDCCRF